VSKTTNHGFNHKETSKRISYKTIMQNTTLEGFLGTKEEKEEKKIE